MSNMSGSSGSRRTGGTTKIRLTGELNILICYKFIVYFVGINNINFKIILLYVKNQ